MSKQNSDLVMHKLLGKHTFVDVMNPDAFEMEKVCSVCKYTENTKPSSIADLNSTNPEKVMAAFRYGMIGANEALKALGLSDKETNEEMDKLLDSLK